MSLGMLGLNGIINLPAVQCWGFLRVASCVLESLE